MICLMDSTVDIAAFVAKMQGLIGGHTRKDVLITVKASRACFGQDWPQPVGGVFRLRLRLLTFN